MTVRFVRTAGAPDRVYVRRSDGSEVSWSFPTYGDTVPHDLVHLVVEQEFGVAMGFWGRVDRGVDPAQINAEANRAGGKNKYAGFGDDLSQLLLAERLAAVAWGMSDPEAEKDLPPEVTAEGLARARQRLGELSSRWRALVPKGTLELTFDL